MKRLKLVFFLILSGRTFPSWNALCLIRLDELVRFFYISILMGKGLIPVSLWLQNWARSNCAPPFIFQVL